MKLYFAGKIGKNDWRTPLVGALAGLGATAAAEEWPTLERAVLGRHAYVGPYFVACDHGCGHAPDGHGARAGAETPGCFEPTPRALVVERCLEAVRRADLVFAWIDSVTAYGTIFELGFARAIGKPIVIAHPRGFYDARDLWFARASAQTLIDADSPIAALEWALGDGASPEIERMLSAELRGAWLAQMLDACESPIEGTMFDALAPHFDFVAEDGDRLAGYGSAGELRSQFQIELDGARYRLDFAILGLARNVAVECDGFDWHDRTPEQATRDKARDRALRRAGWEVLRFTGQEIHRDAAKCAAEAVDAATAREAG